MKRRALPLSLLLVVACGSSETTPVPDPKPAAATLEAYLAADSAFGCRAYACLFGLAPSELPAFCGVDDRIADRAAGVAAGRLAFDGVKAKACVDALNAYRPLDCWGPAADFEADLERLLVTCDGVLAANVAVGGACVLAEECVNGFCGADGETCPGVCRPNRRGGEECSGSEPCVEGLACVGQRCVAIASEGGACTASAGCGPALWCQDGRCAKALVEGDACDPAASHCDPATYCHPAPNTNPGGRCQARVAAGGACRIGSKDTFGVASPQCLGQQVCVGLTENAAGGLDAFGTCGLPSDVGGRCDPTHGTAGPEQPDTGCYLGILCDAATSTCAALPGPGSACVSGACNLGANCVTGRCEAKKAAGAACETSDECVDFCVSKVCGKAVSRCHAG